MLDQLVTQFMGSDAAKAAISDVTRQTELDPAQATGAVQATAEGAAEAAGDGSVADMLGGMLGGGGIGGALGGLGGMLGGGAASADNGIEATIAGFVASKTGLSAPIARAVVDIALPKIMAMLKS